MPVNSNTTFSFYLRSGFNFTVEVKSIISAQQGMNYTRKNACSVTAFNSTDIRSVQDNVATPVTAMMVTVCISTDALWSVFHQCCWSIMPVTACSCGLNEYDMEYSPGSVKQALKIKNILRCGCRILLCNAMHGWSTLMP